MGQKTHPYGFRLGIIKPWRSRWYAGKTFAEFLKEDELVRTLSELSESDSEYVSLQHASSIGIQELQRLLGGAAAAVSGRQNNG